jgi:hypothetical protein
MSIYSSKLNTRRNNSFKNSFPFNIDLYEGNELLVEGYKEFQNKSFKIVYSDLINNKDHVIMGLENFLGITVNENVFEDLSQVNINGIMGDPNLLKSKNNKINNSSLENGN